MAFIPPERAGQLLRGARRRARIRRRQAAQLAGISPARLAEIERGWVDVSAPEFDRLAHCYGESLESLVPRRTPVRLSAGYIEVADRVRIVGDTTDVAREYARLVSAVRAGPDRGLRRDDLAVLAAELGTDSDDIEARIRHRLGCTQAEAAAVRRELLRHRLLAPVAGAAMGAAAITGLVAASGDAPRPTLADEPTATIAPAPTPGVSGPAQVPGLLADEDPDAGL